MKLRHIVDWMTGRTQHDLNLSMFELSPAMKMLIDPADGRLVAVNSATAKFYGYSREELCTLKLQDLDLLTAEDVSEMLLQGYQGGHFVHPHCLASGETRYVELYLGPLRDKQRDLIYAIVHDVTDRERIGERLRLSEERLNLALQERRSGVWEWQSDSGAMWFSRSLCRILPVESGMLLDEFHALVHPTDRLTFIRTFDQLRSGSKEQYRITVHLRLINGTYCWFRDRALAFTDTESGRVTRIIGVCEDISHERQVSEREFQRQKLETVGSLTGGVAHDFNNLLQVISGNLQLLDLTLEEGASDENRALLGEMHEATQSGAGLTRRLLAYSRRQHLKPELLWMEQMMQGFFPLLRRLLPEGVKLSLHSLPAEHDCQVEVDPSQLENALLNLIINARDALPEALGRIDVRLMQIDGLMAHQLCPELSSDVDYLSVTVADNGHGMSAEVLHRCTEPFYTTREVGQGTGLGLSSVVGFVKQSRGDLSIQSMEQEGTCISLLFPILGIGQAPQQNIAHQSQSDMIYGGGQTLLLVEDRADVMATLVRQVHSLGYQVLSAVCVEEALKLLDGRGVDLVLTDVAMPGAQSGFDLARHLIQRDIPVILASGHVGDISEQVPDGVCLLYKPFTSQQLADAIRTSLAKTPD